jgi:hypothetical protein
MLRAAKCPKLESRESPTMFCEHGEHVQQKQWYEHQVFASMHTACDVTLLLLLRCTLPARIVRCRHVLANNAVLLTAVEMTAQMAADHVHA